MALTTDTAPQHRDLPAPAAGPRGPGRGALAGGGRGWRAGRAVDEPLPAAARRRPRRAGARRGRRTRGRPTGGTRSAWSRPTGSASCPDFPYAGDGPARVHGARPDRRLPRGLPRVRRAAGGRGRRGHAARPRRPRHLPGDDERGRAHRRPGRRGHRRRTTRRSPRRCRQPLPAGDHPGAVAGLQVRRAAAAPARCWWSAAASPARRSPRTCTSRAAGCTSSSATPRGSRASTAAATSSTGSPRWATTTCPSPSTRAARPSAPRPTTTSPGATAAATSTCGRTRGTACGSTACMTDHRDGTLHFDPDLTERPGPRRRGLRVDQGHDRQVHRAGAARRPGRGALHAGVAPRRPRRPSWTWRTPTSPRWSGASASARTSGWVDVPVFTGRGAPTHTRGVTSSPGLYFLGLPWQWTWGSGRFSGVGRDAEYLAERIRSQRGLTSTGPRGDVCNVLALGS